MWCQLQAVQPEDPSYPLEPITLDTAILPCLMVEVLNIEWIPRAQNQNSDEDEQWLKFVGASKYGDPKIPDQVRPPPPIYVVQKDPQRVKAKQQYKIKTPTHKWTRHTGECLDLIHDDLVKEPPVPLKQPLAKKTGNNLSRRALREKMKQIVEMIEHHARIRENGASFSSSSSGCSIAPAPSSIRSDALEVPDHFKGYTLDDVIIMMPKAQRQPVPDQSSYDGPAQTKQINLKRPGETEDKCIFIGAHLSEKQ